ncbi:uncharacterized protein [Nicotiana sylvestris]|uniref:uncharacterized protein n=1 Tax=Nicotiana sylvestris TaxID=4096 RepID=UPI00388C7E8C
MLSPYRLQWLNDSGELKVNKRCMIFLNIGRYVDDVLCDVVLIQACHILLGCPWQYDRNTFHDGRKNRYSLELNGKKYTLASLSPSQVFENQKRLREIMEKQRGEKKSELEGKEKKEGQELEKKERWKVLVSGKRQRKEKGEFVHKSQRVFERKKEGLPIILLTYKEDLVNSELLTSYLPSSVSSLLQDFDDIFYEDIPNGLQPLHGIEQ